MPRQPTQLKTQQAATQVPVLLDPIFRVSELLGAFSARSEIFGSIRDRSQVLLPEFLDFFGADLSKTREIPNLASETW